MTRSLFVLALLVAPSVGMAAGSKTCPSFEAVFKDVKTNQCLTVGSDGCYQAAPCAASAQFSAVGSFPDTEHSAVSGAPLSCDDGYEIVLRHNHPVCARDFTEPRDNLNGR